MQSAEISHSGKLRDHGASWLLNDADALKEENDTFGSANYQLGHNMKTKGPPQALFKEVISCSLRADCDKNQIQYLIVEEQNYKEGWTHSPRKSPMLKSGPIRKK